MSRVALALLSLITFGLYALVVAITRLIDAYAETTEHIEGLSALIDEWLDTVFEEPEPCHQVVTENVPNERHDEVMAATDSGLTETAGEDAYAWLLQAKDRMVANMWEVSGNQRRHIEDQRRYVEALNQPDNSGKDVYAALLAAKARVASDPGADNADRQLYIEALNQQISRWPLPVLSTGPWHHAIHRSPDGCATCDRCHYVWSADLLARASIDLDRLYCPIPPRQGFHSTGLLAAACAEEEEV